jgi:hypothetical protein
MTDQLRDLPECSRVLAVEHVDVDADRNGQRGQDAKHGRYRDTSLLKDGHFSRYDFTFCGGGRSSGNRPRGQAGLGSEMR